MTNALSRLDDWIETADGGWVQKSHVVEVRTARGDETAGAATECEALDSAAETIVAEAGNNQEPNQAPPRANKLEPPKECDRKHVEATDGGRQTATGTAAPRTLRH